MVTIKDVAKMAQVAPSTVSRVIANSPRISDKTKRKVRKVMNEMGYHPNLNARSLAVNTTEAIGLVMPSSATKSLNNPFFPEVIKGISSYCHQEGYSITMTTGESDDEIFQDVVKMVQGRRVDGIIVPYSREDDRVVPYLCEKKIPVVLIGKPSFENIGITYVDNDNVKAAKEITRYVINLGHTRIAFIGGFIKYAVTKDRLEGFCSAVQEANLTIPKEYKKHFAFNREEGKKAVEELMSLAKPPTAIIVADDLVALGVLSALREKDIPVPNQVSVVSFNNTLISELASPPLTTVDVNTYELGFEAAKCLLERIKFPHLLNKSVCIPTNLVIRETCQRLDSL